MARIKSVGSISEFMSGEYKQSKKKVKVDKKQVMAAGTSLIPLAAVSQLPTLSFASTSTPIATPETIAIEVNAKEWMGEQTLSALAHVLDPVVDILVALSLPVASVVIVGACFFFMFGNSEKAWSMIQNAGLGYVLIQVSPLILNVLQEVGNAV